MKKLVLTLTVLIIGLSFIHATPNKINDTIKIYSGDKTIIIVSKNKKSDQSDLEFGKQTFENKIEQYQNKIDSIQKMIDSLKLSDKKLNDSLINNKIHQLDKQISEYKKMIEALDKGVKDIDKQLEDMEGKYKNQNSTKSRPKKEIIVKVRSRKFRGHWSGIEFGPNTFLTSNHVLIDQSNIPALSPELNKSFEFNLNFFEANVKIFNFLGLVSGIGLQWNNYKYETFPTYSTSYVLNTDSLYPIKQSDGSNLKQIALKTLYINVPLLVELQFPFGAGNKFYINAGGYAGLNIHSYLKFKSELNGSMIKTKEDVSKMILPYHYGLTARIGIDQVQLYANYSLSSIFRTSQNPELYPIAIGLHINL